MKWDFASRSSNGLTSATFESVSKHHYLQEITFGANAVLCLTFYFAILLCSPQTLSFIFTEQNISAILVEYITITRSHLLPLRVAMSQICKFEKYQDDNS